VNSLGKRNQFFEDRHFLKAAPPRASLNPEFQSTAHGALASPAQKPSDIHSNDIDIDQKEKCHV
jgi:hypothetical protein